VGRYQGMADMTRLSIYYSWAAEVRKSSGTDPKQTARDLAQRLADGHLAASDHSQNVTGFVKAYVNLAGKPRAGNQSN
jgi:hypothetical protein